MDQDVFPDQSADRGPIGDRDLPGAAVAPQPQPLPGRRGWRGRSGWGEVFLGLSMVWLTVDPLRQALEQDKPWWRVFLAAAAIVGGLGMAASGAWTWARPVPTKSSASDGASTHD